MRYAEYAPAPDLAAVVETFWILEGTDAGTAEPIIPDGRVEIVLHFGDPFERHHPDGTVERQGRALLIGQMRAPICIAPRGRAGVAGVRVRPAAIGALLGCAASEVTGQFVDVEAIWGSTSVLREQLAAAPQDGVRVRLLDGWLRERIRGAPDRAIDAAVDAITASAGASSLAAIADRAGISLRQMERRFTADVGLAPKVFARVVRLQRALRVVADGHPLAEAAITCGYYDQAHMARDFARLAETSPAAWRRHAGVLTPLFVRGAGR